jgi:hypothetical protein
MRVVQMRDQGAQRQLLLAAFGTGPHHAFEAFEQAIEPLRADAVGRVGQTATLLRAVVELRRFDLYREIVWGIGQTGLEIE